MTQRDLVFISHATPQDNAFVTWVGLQLARTGYHVWSDITNLVGGERFWQTIEDAIRAHTAKFLFVVSRASNTADGALSELQLASNVARDAGIPDFIIPLRIDDLPFRDVNILLQRLNIIDFTRGWAGGLARILEKLDADGVPRDEAQFNAGVVASWWRDHCEGNEIVRREPEECLSNWFPVAALPNEICVHDVGGGTGPTYPAAYPYSPQGNFVVSFASAADLGLRSAPTNRVATDVLLTRAVHGVPVDDQTARNAVIQMMRSAWVSFMSARGIPIYELSRRFQCGYFTEAVLQGRKRVSFEIPACASGQRGLVGQSRGRVWHFGMSADFQLLPVPAYVVRPHVLFSDDGSNIWTSKPRLHRARRGACADWWNDEWRDRILAAMSWMAGEQGAGHLRIPMSSTAEVQVQLAPVRFKSPATYQEDRVFASQPSHEGDGSDLDDAEDEAPKDEEETQ